MTNGHTAAPYMRLKMLSMEAPQPFTTNANLPSGSLAYQFPSPVVVGEAAIRGVPASYGTQNRIALDGFDIEYSDDGVS